MLVARCSLLALLVFLTSASTQAQGLSLQIPGSGGGITAASPNSASSTLATRLNSTGSCPNTGKQTWVHFDLSSLPSNAILVSAHLQCRAQTGGDGIVYRCGENPVGASWNSVGGDIATIGGGAGVGSSTNQQFSVDVTATVSAWRSGQANFGWVIKGGATDCTDTVWYPPGSGNSNAPRLSIVYQLPDTTPPRVTGVRVESTVAPQGKRTIPPVVAA